MVKQQGPVWLILLILFAALYFTLFEVDQTEKAIVLQFGEPVGKPLEPGFHVKAPILQSVVFLDGRLLHYETPRAEILTADKKSLLVESYAKWEIVDPLKFYITIKDEASARPRLNDVVLSEIRTELGCRTMSETISKLESELMVGVTQRADKAAGEYGIHIVDVGLKRIDLPKENESAVFRRMKSERERQARKYLAEGRREAMKIKAEANKGRVVLLAEANRKAEEIRGQADAETAAIYAAAFGQDPEFYTFTRTLDLYRKTLDQRTTLFLSRDDELMNLMQQSGPAVDKTPTESGGN